MRILKRGLTPDVHCALTAVYEDKGAFPASLWPAQKTGQREDSGERYLLVARPGTDIEQYDRIEWEDKFYRVLWVRAFPKHTEAMLEKEKG
ncbi:MAG: hypothetical protein ACPLYX_10770 [Rectinema subterraneum]|uniref:hypothetical protein n=1 Tax=Rectinema subterraneum TaxID=2653714 RepID=UPI003C79CD10